MSAFKDINLERLPAPQVVEPLDFETILSEMLDDLRTRLPELTIELESDPVYKILEVAAYRELIIRSRINDAAKSVMLAYAVEGDLDNLSAFFGVERQIVSPGDPSAIPPVPPVYESNERLRRRTQLSLEGFTTAGSIGSYIFHTLTAHALIKDVEVSSPNPGEVVVTVLSSEGDGDPSAEILTAVERKLTAEEIRPLTDNVILGETSIIEYAVDAELILFGEPDADVVRQAAEDALSLFVSDNHRLGRDVSLSGIYAALHQPGVQRVILNSPSSDLVIVPNEAAYCNQIDIVVGGRNE